MAESEEKLKALLKVKEESEITGLKINIQKIKITASCHMANRMKKSGCNDRFSFLGLQKSLGMVTVATKLKDA